MNNELEITRKSEVEVYFKALHLYVLRGAEENHANPQAGQRSPCRYSNPGSSE